MILTNNPHEPQRITLNIVFKVRHKPFTEEHARQLLINHFKSKGVEFNGEEIII